MNRHLLRSPALLLPVAALGAALFLGAWAGAPQERALRSISGWALLLILVSAAAYLLRKQMHRRGFSPEFRLRVPIEALERAQVHLAALRREVARGTLGGARVVSRAADQVLRREGVQRVYRVRVRPGAAGEPPFVLSTEKTFPLLHSSRWMRGHLALGTSFAILLLAHGGLAPRSGLGWALLASGVVVVASGVVGLVQWVRGPARLTRLERDLSIEEAFAFEEHLRRKLEEHMGTLEGGAARTLRRWVDAPPTTEQARALREAAVAGSPERAGLEDALVLRAQHARVRAELRVLTRARSRMHAWRAAHLPAVVMLLVFVALHLFAVWRY